MHELIARVPTLEEYTKLCRAVGWATGTLEGQAITLGSEAIGIWRTQGFAAALRTDTLQLLGLGLREFCQEFELG